MKRLFTGILTSVFFLATFTGARALENHYAKAKKFNTPIREQSVIVTEEGYYPENIVLFEGEKLRLFVTSTGERPSCLLIKEKEIFLPANKGKVSEGVAYFKTPGVYKMFCPTGGIQGTITVLEKPNTIKKMKRELASEGIIKVWMPRND